MTSSSHTLGRWVADRAATQPDSVAVDDNGVTVSYAQLSRRIDALAARLRAAGYGIGDRVATVSGNTTDHIVLFFACARVGMVFVPLSWRLTPAELSALLEQADPVLVAVEDEHGSAAVHAAKLAGRADPIVSLGAAGLESLVPARYEANGTTREPHDDDPLMIIFTSGSEARPKGVVLSHANCFWTNLALASAVQLTRDDVVLATLPQFHVAAWNCQPLLALWVGARLVLERSFHAARTLQLIADRRVTAMMGVPTQYRMLADDAAFEETDLSSLRYALVGGATVGDALADAWARREVRLTQGYGLTEASPNVACARPGQRGSIGSEYAHVEIMLADPMTQGPLAGEAIGELWVRGPSVFSGYWRDENATEQAMAGDWLRTGDIAARDADGSYRIVDRLKDFYISGGENVAPAEVEAALELHENIARAGVVGIADDVWGERGLAFVVAKRPMSADEVITHARTRLAGYKVPVQVVFVAELPTSSIDKLARAELRAWARQTVGAQRD